MVVIAPSFGFGNWLRPQAVSSVLAALDDAATLVEIDQEQVFLAGISNGGLGVSQLGAAAPERFAGLLFLSPVMATHLLESGTFLENWTGRPVLVLTGKADERVPYEYVQHHVRLLEGAGVSVTENAYPGEDHFLFFSRPEDILDDASEWLLQNQGAAILP
jgi:predicted esterase